MAGYCRSASVQEGYKRRMENRITPDITNMSAELLQEEECDMEVYLLAFVFLELLVFSVTPRPIHPQEMGCKKGKVVPKLKKVPLQEEDLGR